MIPHEARRGTSFKGWYLYHLHDKKASTTKRVGWTQTLNMLTDDPAKAWKVMAYTALTSNRLKEATGASHVGRKMRLPVFSYSLSWHPDESPTRDQMLEAAYASIKAIGLSEHEGLIVEHTDTPHSHVHIGINRVHPITGYIADTGNTWRKLSTFALNWEQKQGIIHCPQREENHQMRQEGKNSNYRNPIILNAWLNSVSGKNFTQILQEEGYHLAQGRKRLVVVDPYGKIHNPVRHIEGINSKDFWNKVEDLDLTNLQDADTLAANIQEFRNNYYEDYQASHNQMPNDAKTTEEHQTTEEDQEHKASALKALQSKQEQESLNLSQTYQRIINQRETELRQAFKMNAYKAEIEALQEKVERPKLLQRIFGLNSYRLIRLKSLRNKFNVASMSIEQKLLPYADQKAQALDQLKILHWEKRDELLASFGKATSRAIPNDPILIIGFE